MIRLELVNVSHDADTGKYEVHVRAVRDSDGKLMGRKSFEVETVAELKSKVKPIFESIVARQKSTIVAAVQGVLDEIMNEVQQ